MAGLNVNYEMKIPAVLEYEGIQFPSVTDNVEDCTLLDQIVDLLMIADQNYAEAMAGHDSDPAFCLIDAIKILNGALSALDEETS